MLKHVLGCVALMALVVVGFVLITAKPAEPLWGVARHDQHLGRIAVPPGVRAVAKVYSN